jgi:hypothetical protein
MQNYIIYFRIQILKTIGGPTNMCLTLFRHLKNSLIYHFFRLFSGGAQHPTKEGLIHVAATTDCWFA